mgnify:FL=1
MGKERNSKKFQKNTDTNVYSLQTVDIRMKYTMDDLKKGIRGHDIQAKGLKNIAFLAEKTGIEYLQLVLEKSIDGFDRISYTEKYAEEIKHQLGNVKIAILGSYIDPSNPDDTVLEYNINKFKEKIRYASILKPIAVGTETGIYKEHMTDSEEAYKRVLHTLKTLALYAQEYGVNIGIEGVHCFVINTPQKMKKLIDDLSLDNVKVIYDPVNYLDINNYKEQNHIIESAFDLLSDKICVLHAKDFVVENGVFKEVKPTEGLLNYKLIFNRLNKYKLNIPIICEGINESDASIAFELFEKIRRD